MQSATKRIDNIDDNTIETKYQFSNQMKREVMYIKKERKEITSDVTE